MTAKLIAIEGLDGSGKETQTGLLEQALLEAGYKVGSVSFPRYGTVGAAPAEEYLNGGYGKNAPDVNAYAASSLFAVDRLTSYLKEWKTDYEHSDYFIANRYTTSNCVYQLSKLPESHWELFTEWLFDYEYEKLGLPKPAIVIYLRIDLETSQDLLMRRYGGDISRRDVHERDLGYQMRSKAAAEWCAERFGWMTVDCAKQGKLLEKHKISTVILNALKEKKQESSVGIMDIA